jgi:uncharacterized membrane protein YeaQ/YmgE (transglycosylase-associated protein family)
MGPYVWCVVGIVLGWVTASIGGGVSFVERMESVAVGVFGAFLGGEFLPAMFFGPDPAVKGLGPGTVAISVVSCLVALALLRWMRKAVGPLKAGKKRKRA